MAVLTIQTIPTGYDQTLDAMAWQALSAGADDTFISTGREILLFRNDDGAAPVVVTVTSENDPQGRTGDTTLSVPVGEYAVSQLFPRVGWAASTGLISIVCADADMKCVVLRLP